MTNSTGSLLMAAAFAAFGIAEAQAADLLSTHMAQPKVIASSRSAMLNQAETSLQLRKPAKKLHAKSSSRQRVAKFAETSEETLLYSCSFAFLTEGSEDAPAPLKLDDMDNIPEELIGEADYGFGGQGLMQAGGAVYIPFEYNADPDDEDGWYEEGMLWTPDVYEPMEITIELDAKIAEGCDYDEDELWVYASDYANLIGYDDAPISTEWSHVIFNLNINNFIPESEDDSYYFTLFPYDGADVLLKNVVIKGKKAALTVPVAEAYTDFTGDSFTANWSEVDGATGYYLTVYNFDPATRQNTSVQLEDQFTEENSFKVTGLTPGSFYSYRVAATNGEFTTDPSNFIIVCELVPPTGMLLKPGEDNQSLVASWYDSPGANYYVLSVNSIQDVKGGQTVMLADADFSGIESTGSVAVPEESDFWYESRPQLPGWEFSLGCSAPGAFGFQDNAYYTSMIGIQASLASFDYDLSNIKDSKVNVSIEAASPGNGMLMGLLAFNESTLKYDVASVYGTPADIPEDYATYEFSLAGANDQTQFLIITRTEENADGALLIRKLQVSAEALADGTVQMPVASVQTATTYSTIDTAIESNVTYLASVIPYLVDDKGYILAVGHPSEVATFKADGSAVSTIDTDSNPVFYNLQGQKIAKPAKGTPVIKVSGEKASKTIF